MRALLFIVALVVMVSCGSQRMLQKTYIGKPLSAMEKELGEAKTVFNKKSGDVYIFEKVEMLKSTEISQHKLTLDPMVTPQVRKTSHYKVTVVDDVITKVELEEIYERNK
ncbi:hypothetical protein [Draconibacterium halophilum]|uniref:Uncharacterized protein n=1 Tax=Draconibacterium halophilum TaxID=2706887 RepID=A0A6C0RCH9_9BACT|nr:hypothetical protein [Draconibacterium halophilum]QIA07455.1 hypothetical protein G0Q07_06835 [Draconibacterium halophilum]